MSQELSLILKANFRKEVRLCTKCWMKECCGHIQGHPQDGCIRYYELKDTSGKVACFIDFKYSQNRIKQLSCATAGANPLQNAIAQELSRQ